MFFYLICKHFYYFNLIAVSLLSFWVIYILNLSIEEMGMTEMNKIKNNYLLSKEDQTLLKQFESILLNQNIYYPFHPIKHINHEFLNFINGVGKNLLTNFVMKEKSRQIIFNKLMNISYQYLAKNNYQIDAYELNKNWINLINLAYCSSPINFNIPHLLEKVDEANRMFN